MSDGIEIVDDLKFAEPDERLIPTADRTKTVEAMGTIEPDDLQIFLRRGTLIEVVRYAKTNLTRELGGVLVGTFHHWRGQIWIDVDGYVKATRFQNTAASFTFTHDSWSDVTREKEKKYNDKPIVGWQHTHPGYGVFLSGMDMFIQNHFFNLPYQVALVVDPRADELGFFQWKRGKVVHCGFYYVK